MARGLESTSPPLLNTLTYPPELSYIYHIILNSINSNFY